MAVGQEVKARRQGGTKAGRQALLPFGLATFLPFCLATFQPFCLTVSAQDVSFRSGSSELVVLPVVVTDTQGRYISDLGRERFTVFDNGRRIPIEIFTNEDTPLTIGLIIDSSGSMRLKMAEVVSASLAFARLSNPQDELFAIRFNDDVQKVIRDRQFLLAQDQAALTIALRSMRPDGRTALYDALVAGIDQLTLGSRARKVLVVISDGGDNASRHAEQEMLDRVAMSNALVYTVVDPDVFTPGEGDRGVLKRLAKLSGGVAYFPKNSRDLVKDLEEIAGNIRRGYSIGYAPQSTHVHNRTHRVKVVVRVPGRKDLSARVRNVYMESD